MAGWASGGQIGSYAAEKKTDGTEASSCREGLIIFIAAVLAGMSVPADLYAPLPYLVAVPIEAPSALDSVAMAAAKRDRARMEVAPQPLDRVPADYPDGERRAHHDGITAVHAILGVDGRLSDISIRKSSGHSMLDSAAVAAMRASRFTPATTADGTPIAVAVVLQELFEPSLGEPRVATPVTPDFPGAEQAAGHHGTVRIQGLIGVDGRLIDATVSTRSRAPGLDAAALAAARATVLRPLRYRSGAVVSRFATLNFSFSSLSGAGTGGGLLRYRCDQFVRDEDWWRATWPSTDHDEIRAAMIALRLNATERDDRAEIPDVGGMVRDLDRRWLDGISACRARPQAMVLDIFQPEGEWAKHQNAPRSAD